MVTHHSSRDRTALNNQAGTDAALNKCFRKFSCKRMGGFPTRAMPGHNQPRANCFQLINGGWNNRLEDTAGQMQSSEQCINRIDAGEFLSVTNRIDGTRMTAAGQYDESFVPHIHHQSLIVMDERIGMPRAIDLGIVNRKSLLEVCAAMDLSCY
jgi:hypothetical protein